MHLPIPLPVLYAGLGGVLLALIVATAQNKWQPRVFVLLALRLAIGWHFLVEGFQKVQSRYLIGETITNRPFSSAGYFREAPGPLGGFVRWTAGDPDEGASPGSEPGPSPASSGDVPDFHDAHLPEDHRERAADEQDKPDLPDVPDLSEDAQDDKAELAKAEDESDDEDDDSDDSDDDDSDDGESDDSEES